MGCISSKLLVKSGSFSEKVNQTLQKRSNALEEILISNSKSSNNQQQFLSLFCSTNTVTSLKPSSELNGSDTISEQIHLDKDPNQSPSPGPTKVETINTWELLAGLEEEKEEKEDDIHEVRNAEQRAEEISSGKNKEVITGKTRSFRTVDDLNLIFASSEIEDGSKSTNEDTNSSGDTSSSSSSSVGAKRKARAKELAELKLPAFEFGKSGSLRDWLLKGGQIFSPGSYITPKFGSSDQKEGIVNGSNGEELGAGCVFDPEMLAQFEEAIEEMRKEEESVLKEIVERLEENAEKEMPVMNFGKDFVDNVKVITDLT